MYQLISGDIGVQVDANQLIRAHLHVEAKDKNGKRTSILGKKYGTVTNQEFFETFNGDWKKLKAYKDAQNSSSEDTIENDNCEDEKCPVDTPQPIKQE